MRLVVAVLWVLACMGLAGAGLVPFGAEEWESGYANAAPGGDRLFYVLVKNRVSNTSAPLIIWLNGGPGCSSSYGLFIENGPVYLNRTDKKFYMNPHSWNTFADMLYVDQPVGVGYSLARDASTLCKNEICVANKFYVFLRNFLEQHPEFRGRDLYLSGESYAGHYIPAIASHILRSNNPEMKLKGAAIGNPLTRIGLQFLAYAQFLYENGIFGIVKYILGKAISLVCYVAEQTNMPPMYLLDVCDMSFAGLNQIPNMYDIRENRSYDDMDDVVIGLLNRTDVQAEFGVKDVNYAMCNSTIGNYMTLDIPTSRSEDLEYMLSRRDFSLMLYFGDQDYICNWRGGEQLADSLVWDGRNDFLAEGHKVWRDAAGNPAGTYRKHENFNFLKVSGAGHMVPLDQPQFALSMIKKFVYGQFQGKVF